MGYVYRMETTEVTKAQWFEFVNAYSTYYTGFVDDTIFTSSGIIFNPLVDRYVLRAGEENTPASGVTWRFAARYVNGLNNSKAITREAFETGAYDTSTFTKKRRPHT